MGNKTSGGAEKMDVLQGPILKKVIAFALPVAIGSILQQLFNMCDTAIVGRFASSQALAAVGANSSVVSLFLNLFMGIAVGTGVVVANYLGSGNKEAISRVVHTSVSIAAIFGVILAIVVQFAAAPLLLLMGIPEDVLALGVVYLRIYGLGMPFILLYNFGASILRSAGDSKRPVYILIFSGIINAVLNMILVILFKRSVDGVAIATVVSNVIATILIFYLLSKEDEMLRFSFRKLGISKRELIHILQIGVPAGLQGMVFSLSNTVIQSCLNSFGSAAVAGSAVAVNFEYIGYFIITGFNQAAVTFVGQNCGAGNMARCKKIWKTTLLSGLLLALLADVLFIIFRMPIINLFTTDAAVIPYASERVLLLIVFHWIISIYEITGSTLRGYGYSLTPALTTVFGTCVLRLAWVFYVNNYHHTYKMLLAVYPISWVVTASLMVLVYVRVIRKMEGVAE